MSEEGSTTTRTDFGIMLGTLAERKRGLRSFAAIARAMNAAGYEVNGETVRRWSYGTSPMPQRALHVLRDILRLTEEEQRQLGILYAWTQQRMEEDFSEGLVVA